VQDEEYLTAVDKDSILRYKRSVDFQIKESKHLKKKLKTRKKLLNWIFDTKSSHGNRTGDSKSHPRNRRQTDPFGATQFTYLKSYYCAQVIFKLVTFFSLSQDEITFKKISQ